MRWVWEVEVGWNEYEWWSSYEVSINGGGSMRWVWRGRVGTKWVWMGGGGRDGWRLVVGGDGKKVLLKRRSQPSVWGCHFPPRPCHGAGRPPSSSRTSREWAVTFTLRLSWTTGLLLYSLGCHRKGLPLSSLVLSWDRAATFFLGAVMGWSCHLPPWDCHWPGLLILLLMVIIGAGLSLSYIGFSWDRSRGRLFRR